MIALLRHIRRKAARDPEAPALRDGVAELSYGELEREIDLLAETLTGERIGILLDNGIAWACLDLAILRRGAVCVPMPTFFSPDQLRHLVRDAGLDRIVTDQPERVSVLLQEQPITTLLVGQRRLSLFVLPKVGAAPDLPTGTVKVTYTSGTTGQPQGVCLSGVALQEATAGLCEAVAADPVDRALSLLPLSTLLENIAGLYAPLWVGALAQLPSLASCGFAGSSELSMDRLFATFKRTAPTTIVLVPQLLKAIVSGVAAGLPRPDSLRFVAVGGAPVADSLMQQARDLGLPVFQGYGLSEAGSVVCLNQPGADRPGSVGRPLPGMEVGIAADGEVIVAGRLFLGYLGAPEQTTPTAWPTGDLGHLDAEGYLYLSGRKKTAYATAYGRNVAPEWLEGALTAQPYIAQAAVYGAERPFNIAVLVPRPGIAPHQINQAVAEVNRHLPDYARIGAWICADQPFTVANHQIRPAGGIYRSAIHAAYRQRIEQLYADEEKIYAVL